MFEALVLLDLVLETVVGIDNLRRDVGQFLQRVVLAQISQQIDAVGQQLQLRQVAQADRQPRRLSWAEGARGADRELGLAKADQLLTCAPAFGAVAGLAHQCFEFCYRLLQLARRLRQGGDDCASLMGLRCPGKTGDQGAQTGLGRPGLLALPCYIGQREMAAGCELAVGVASQVALEGPQRRWALLLAQQHLRLVVGRAFDRAARRLPVFAGGELAQIFGQAADRRVGAGSLETGLAGLEGGFTRLAVGRKLLAVAVPGGDRAVQISGGAQRESDLERGVLGFLGPRKALDQRLPAGDAPLAASRTAGRAEALAELVVGPRGVRGVRVLVEQCAEVDACLGHVPSTKARLPITMLPARPQAHVGQSAMVQRGRPQIRRRFLLRQQGAPACHGAAQVGHPLQPHRDLGQVA